MELYFTSDTHFSHIPSFLWEPRGFSSVEEMNEAIVERWNRVVKPEDRVIHLGDVILSDTEKGLAYFKRLNGEICLVFGNHDTLHRQEELAKLPNVIVLGYAHVFKYKKLSFYVSHYPSLVANYDDKHFSQHVINLHGHTHQQANFLYPNNPFIYHVGVDSHNCTPVHIDEVITDIRQRWNDLQTLNIPIQELYMYPMKENKNE